jgi:3-oxoadipate enol-lactonase
MTVLLLHAFPLDATMWDSTIAALKDHRVIAMNLRGFGGAPLSAPYSIADLADDAVAELDRQGVPMATVCGLSMGGYVALAIAQRHAARLAGLVLADTRAGADSPDGKKGRDTGIATVREKGVAAFVAPLVDKLLSPQAPADLKARVRALGERQSPDAIIAALTALRDRPDRTAELPSIRVPTLVIVGSADGVTPPSESRAMATAIPGAKLVEIPGAGHLSNLEQPAAFNSALAEFVAEIA